MKNNSKFKIKHSKLTNGLHVKKSSLSQLLMS